MTARREEAVPGGAAAPRRARPSGGDASRVAEAGEAPGIVASAATAEELAALEALPVKGGTWLVGGREVPLTNLDRPLFPAAGLVKRDLIRYYVLVAPTMLPYLAGRALNLTRWPQGVGGPHFWQKELPAWVPSWLARRYIAGSSREESHTYVIADHVATLAWLANQAAIEIHPWTSPAEHPDEPSYALVDIDPGTRTTWDETLVIARLYREALRHLGVRGCPKVTGKRGIQVWIPVRRGYTFDRTRTWVEAVSRVVARAVPELVSWEWETSRRRGLARLDYTQNAVNKTLVAPYAVRATATASVSMPIGWDELEDPALRPDRWTIEDALERVAAVGDLFRDVIGPGQELPALE